MKKIVVKLSVVLTLLCATSFGSCQTNPEVADVKSFNYAWVDSEEPYREDGSGYMLEYYEGLRFEENFQPIMDTSYTLLIDDKVAEEFYKIVDKCHKELMEVTDDYFDIVMDKYKYIIDNSFIVVRYNDGTTKLELNK